MLNFCQSAWCLICICLVLTLLRSYLSDFIEMNLYMQKFFIIIIIIIIIVFCIAKVEYKDFCGYCMSRMFYLF